MKLIPLTQSQFAMVDDEDYERVLSYKHPWYSARSRDKGYYAVSSGGASGSRKIKTKNKKMHRFILEVTDPKIFVDHIDGNTLNNQKNNLRKCSPKDNCRNKFSRWGKSKYIGVSFLNCKGRWFYWHSAIRVNSKPIFLGSFPLTDEGEIAAAKAYDEAAKKHFGEFANLNFKD